MKKITLLLIAFITSIWSVNAQSLINITTSGGSYGTEKWVSITTEADGAGTQIWGQGDGSYGNGAGFINEDVSIAPGTYYVNCYDKYDDGWDGTLITVSAYSNTIGDNGGVSPSDDNDIDSGSAWETPADELEASFVIVVPDPPSCIPVSGVTVAPTSGTDVSIAWTAGSSETGWSYEYGATGFTQGDGTSGTTSTTSIDISGLTLGTTYDIYIQANCTGENSSWVLATFTMPIAGDNIATAVPITPAAAGTGCDAAGFTLSFSSDGTTDSGLDGSCNTSDTGLDQFFTWTATSDGLLFNDTTPGNPGIVVRDASGNEISCAGTFAADDSILSGWAIGDDLIIQIYDYGTSVSDVAFCLEEFSMPAMPNCAENLSPTDGATNVTIPQAVITVSWDAPATGVTPTGYEVFLGTTSGTLSSLGTTEETSVNISNLNYDTTYYWKVVSKNGVSAAADCSELSFTTQSASVPFISDFENFPSGWFEAAGAFGSPAGTTSSFVQGDLGNDTDNVNGKSAKVNIYGTSTDEYLISPVLDLSTGTHYLNFDIALTAYATTTAATLGADDYLALLVTQDAGASWQELTRWDADSTLGNTGDPIAEIELTGYGAAVQFAFYAFSDTSNVDNDLFIDNFQVTASSLTAPSTPTTDAPTPPARQAGDVVSVYSDAYTNINVTNFNPGWGQTGAVDAAYDPTGAGTNTVLEYSNFNYQGTEFAVTDASAMEFVHIDIWTADATDVKFSPINNGTGTAEVLVNVPLVTGAWSSVDIAIADFTGMTWDSLFQMKFDGGAGVNPSTIYLDNVYFWKNPTTAPTTDAPTPPAREAGDVVSVYSDAYTNINVTNFNPGWGQTGAVDAAYDPTGAGSNTVLEYSNFNYQGTEFDATDASAMEFVHIDIWTADATDVKFSPINNGTGTAEILVNLPLVTGGWSSVDIAIADFTGMTWDSLFQMKFDGGAGVNPSTIYIDNVYFYREAVPPVTAPVTDAPTPPAREAGDVISVYSDAYTNINVTNFNPGWGQTGAVDAAYDPTGAGTNTVLEYSNFNYQGTEFDATDTSAMEFVHIDIWTANATDVKFSPINNGTGAGEFLVNIPVVTGEWSSVDIAIADFTGMTWDSLFQMKFDGQGGVNPSAIYIDNVYFYKEPSTTSDVIFITELADPNDNAAARYVEIYNGGASAVDLTGWTLRRYTNGNADPQTTGEDLTPIGSLAPGAIAIIAANGTAFEAAFGMVADISAGTGGPADSNGDDQIYITDASDAIVDFFGVAGEDGSGTGHEFEDGRAERKASVTQGTATWDVNEWNIDNDGGDGDGALNVDGGFDPGVWIGAETAGVEDESLVTLNMYPNPASDVLNISAQSTINTVEIYNVLGQKVISMQVENTSAEINVSNLNAGIYLIKYEINNSTSTKKFVKN